VEKALELNDCFARDILALLESFSEKDAAGKQSLRQLLISDPHAFRAAGIRVLARVGASAGARYLVHLLTKEKMLLAGLLDQRACRLKDAVAAARSIVEKGTPLQQPLEFVLGKALQGQSNPENTSHLLRILDLLAAISARS